MPALPALIDLDLSFARLTSLQGMPALPALTKLNLFSASLTSLEGFDQLKSSPKLEKIIVMRGQIDLAAVPEELRRLGVIAVER